MGIEHYETQCFQDRDRYSYDRWVEREKEREKAGSDQSATGDLQDDDDLPAEQEQPGSDHSTTGDLRDGDDLPAEQEQHGSDQPATDAEEQAKRLNRPIALITGLRWAYQLFDFGLFEKTLITCAHRPSCPELIFSV